MALPATDTFTGTDHSALSGNWTTHFGTTEILSNRFHGSSLAENIASFTGETFTDAQQIQGTLIVSGATVNNGETLLENGSRRYAVIWNLVGTSGIYNVSGSTSFTYTLLQSLSAFGGSDAVVLFTRDASDVLRAYISGVQTGPDTNGVGYTTGRPGLYTAGNASYWDDVTVNNLGAAASLLVPSARVLRQLLAH
jgi:hypothetical protein